MSIILKSTGEAFNTLTEAIAALPSTGDTVIIADETISESQNGVDKKIVWDISDTTFTNNNRSGYGGAIDVTGNITGGSIHDSVFSNNSAASGGGAIFVRSGADLHVNNVTFTGNTAANGGAIRNMGTLTVTDCIFSGNTSGNKESCIRNEGTLYLGNVTFTGNTIGDNPAQGSIISNTGSATKLYVTGKITLGVGQTIYNNQGVFQIVGGSFLTAKKGVAKAVDAADSSQWFYYYKKDMTASSGYQLFTATDNDLYVTNAETVVGTVATVGDYAAVVGGTAFYGTHYDTIAGAAGASTVVVSGYTSAAAEQVAAGQTLLITGSEVGPLTFAGSNSVVLGADRVDFTNQDLSGVALSIAGDFANGTTTVATGIAGLPATVAVDGEALIVNSTGTVPAGNTGAIRRVTAEGGELQFQSADTITIVQTQSANGFDTFSTLAAAQQTYATFTGGTKYDITGYCNNWSAESVPAVITVDGRDYWMVWGENAFNTTSPAKAARSEDGTFIHYNTNIYAMPLADIHMIIHGGSLVKNRADLYAGTAARYVDVTLDGVNASNVQQTQIGANTDVVSGDWRSAVSNMVSTYVSSSQRGNVYMSNGFVGGNVTAAVKNSELNAVYVKKGGECAGNITATVTDSIIASDLTLYTGESEALGRNVTIDVAGSSIGGRIISSGSRRAVIDGDVAVTLTDSVVNDHILLAYGHMTYGGNTITGNAAVTLNGSTTGGVFRTMNTGEILGDVTLTAASGLSQVGTVEGIDTLTVRSGATLDVARFAACDAGSAIALENGYAGFTLAALDIAAGAAVSFTAGTFDLSDTYITVDAAGLAVGDVIATGVTGVGGYALVGAAADMFLRVDGTDLITYTRAADVNDSTSVDTYTGTGDCLMTGGVITGAFFGTNAAAGSVRTVITGGTVGNAVIGGAKVASGNTAALGAVTLNIMGDADIVGGTANGGMLYTAGYAYGASESALDENPTLTVEKSVLTLTAGSIPAQNLYAGAHARKGAYTLVDETEVNVSGGSFARIYGGGWAEKNAKSVVGSSTVTVTGGSLDYIYAGGGNGPSGETRVTGNVDIAISDDAAVNFVFLAGKNQHCTIGGKVTLTLTGDAKTMTRVSGHNACGTNGTEGTTTLNLQTSLNVDYLDYVDVIRIAEGMTLNVGVNLQFEANVAALIDFDLEGALDTDWTAMSGVGMDLYKAAQYTIDGGEAVYTYDEETGALGDSGYGLDFSEENKVKFIALA